MMDMYSQLYDFCKKNDAENRMFISKDAFLHYVHYDKTSTLPEKYNELKPIDYICLMYFILLGRAIDIKAYEYWDKQCKKNGEEAKRNIVNILKSSDEYTGKG